MAAVLQYALGRFEQAAQIGPFIADVSHAFVLHETGSWRPDEYSELPARLRTLLPLISRAKLLAGRLHRIQSRIY